MSAKRFMVMLCAALLPWSTAAVAQDDDEDTIIVEGNREITVGDLRRQARSITPRAGSVGEPLPRFHQEICVGVWGLSVESARLVIDRIYYNAESIGLPVSDEEGCTPNVILAIAEDPEAEFAAMREEGHPLLNRLDLWARKRVVRENEGPVLAWNVILERTNNGELLLGDAPVNATTMMSRTMTSTTNEIGISIVMVARDVAAGVDGVSLADYVTMRALAQTRQPIEPVSTSTILGLFSETGERPTRLTPFDRAYLTGLYHSPENRPMRMTLATIGSRMRHALAREE